ncbi:SMR family transporter [Candidatus Njordibacter sp. Uisw_056]|jgi:small multidrug resistance pump|uniref:DMT family transporter n=1 Tax=Candidatus Njordibacter sp. Uisw_056 TaxID=3230973 RepID=UPI003D3A3C82|tara:strand:+ start:606 stop:938 length:333 start_codon:yes stop_codon:yes gene_type:complete
MKSWFLLFLAVVFEVVGTSAIKQSAGFTKFFPSLAVAVCFVVSFYLLTFSLKVLPIGVVYAVWSGMGIVLISVIGHWFFNERLDTPAIIGISFILSGVIIMQIFSRAVAH